MKDSKAFFIAMSYEEQLKDPRWKAFRDMIIERDWGMCQKCLSSKNLQVHHKEYINGKMAWEYSGWYVITLCDYCHREVHGLNPTLDYSNCKPVRKISEVIIDWIHGK